MPVPATNNSHWLQPHPQMMKNKLKSSGDGVVSLLSVTHLIFRAVYLVLCSWNIYCFTGHVGYWSTILWRTHRVSCPTHWGKYINNKEHAHSSSNHINFQSRICRRDQLLPHFSQPFRWHPQNSLFLLQCNKLMIKSQPFQFKLCGVIQLILDVFVIAQIGYYSLRVKLNEFQDEDQSSSKESSGVNGVSE